MRAFLVLLTASCALMGCTQAAPGKDSPSLRIVTRMHPDPQQMKAHMDDRMALCMLQLRAKGVQAVAPALPNPADMAKWVTRETEEIYANGQRATYATDVLVWPNVEKSCQWTFYKTVHAEAETLCADWYAGSAKSDPNPDATPEPPDFSRESTPSGSIKRCLADAAKTGNAAGMPKGVTAGGQTCLWLSDSAGGGAGPMEPKEPGQYFCTHPRAYDGSLPKYRRDPGLTLKYLRILPPGVRRGNTPEVDADRMEAEIVEEGKPIAASRFTQQAVEAFVKQPLVVPVGGQL